MGNALRMLIGYEQRVVERRVAKREHDAVIDNGLVCMLQSYASATTKAEQTALLGEVLNQWAETGDGAGNFNTSVERAQEEGFTLSYRAPNGTDVTEWVELLETFNGMPFVQVGAGRPGVMHFCRVVAANQPWRMIA